MIADTSLKTGWHRGKGRLLGSGARDRGGHRVIADTSLKTGWHRGKADGDRGGHREGKKIKPFLTHTALMNKKDIVAKVIQFLVTVLSAVLTTFGLQGTM